MALCRARTMLIALLSLWLASCAAGGDPRLPIPTAKVSAAGPATQLVVMLPGRGDDLPSLARTGIAARIQRAWPDADVVLTGLTMPYYRQDQAVQRLQREIIEPARRSGRYRRIWLAGISLGGLGALLYDQAHPGEVDGLLLMSPYLGDDAHPARDPRCRRARSLATPARYSRSGRTPSSASCGAT